MAAGHSENERAWQRTNEPNATLAVLRLQKFIVPTERRPTTSTRVRHRWALVAATIKARSTDHGWGRLVNRGANKQFALGNACDWVFPAGIAQWKRSGDDDENSQIRNLVIRRSACRGPFHVIHSLNSGFWLLEIIQRQILLLTKRTKELWTEKDGTECKEWQLRYLAPVQSDDELGSRKIAITLKGTTSQLLK